jgi:hypothetical protein
MRLALLTISLTISVLGCKLDNPAFEDGQEFADENGTFETSGAEQDVGSTDESGASDQDSNASNTLEGSSTVGEDTTSSDDASTIDSSTIDSSTTDDDPSTSSSDDGMSTSESGTTEETGSSSEDTLDGPIESCPQVVIVDCKTCIQSNCCFDDGDLACIEGSDVPCGCVLDCLIDTDAMANCGDACEAGNEPLAHANQLYTCTMNFCEQWC